MKKNRENFSLKKIKIKIKAIERFRDV